MGFGKDGKGAIVMESRSQALGALAAGVGILIGTKLAITEDYRMLKCNVTGLITGLTANEGFGLALYLINGDLTLAEAEAKIEQNGPLSRHAKIENEIVSRFVRKVGQTIARNSAATTATIVDMHTNAPICVVKPRWTFGKVTSWQWLIYNHGIVITTGATMQLKTESFGLWLE